MNEANRQQGQNGASQRWITVLIAAVAGHLALLVVGRNVLVSVSEGRAAGSLVPAATSAAAILLAAPVGSRLFVNRSAKAWWLVAPAAVVLAFGALRASWSNSTAADSLASAALTAFGASLALSCAAAVLAVHATMSCRRFAKGRAAVPLVVGLGGLAVVTLAALAKAPAALLALPAALIGVTAIAVAAGASEHSPPRGAASDAILISWISLGAIALASFATAAAAFTATADVPLHEHTRRMVVIGWFHSFPVVAAMIAGFGLRLSQVGNAARATKLDVIGTVALLVIGIATARNQVQAAFASPVRSRSAAPVLATKAPDQRATARTPLPAATAPSPARDADAASDAPAIEQGSLRVGYPIVDGPLLAKDAVAGMERSAERLHECYQKLGDDRAPVRGALRFVVDRGGSVAHVEMRDATLPDALVKCISLELYRTGFASPNGGRATVTAPIEFKDPE
jgi:hypothetical protein